MLTSRWSADLLGLLIVTICLTGCAGTSANHHSRAHDIAARKRTAPSNSIAEPSELAEELDEIQFAEFENEVMHR